MKRMHYLIMMALLFWSGLSQAQLKFQFDPSSANMVIGEERTFNLVVTEGFTGLLGLEFTMVFDNGRLDFVDAWPLLDTLGAFQGMALNYIPPPGTPFLGTGIRLLWDDVQGTGKTLAPGTPVAAVRLRAKALGSSQLRVFCAPQNQYNCEYVDGNGDHFDISGTPATINVIAGSNGPTLTIAQVTGASGSVVCVPVTATKFNAIQSMQFSMNWQTPMLSFASLNNCNVAMNIQCIPDPPNFGISGNALNFSWTNPSGGVTLPDGSTLFEVCFNVNGTMGQTATVNFSGNIEVYDTNDVNLPVSTINGSVTVGNSKTLTLELKPQNACPLDTFCVPLFTKNFTNIIGLSTFMTFDTTKVKLVGIKGCNPKLTGINCNLGSLSFNLNTTGDTLAILYEDPTGVGVTLDTSDVFVNFCFENLMAIGDSVNIRFLSANSNGNPSEAVDVDLNTVALIQKNGKAYTVQCVCDLSVSAALTTNVTCPGGNNGAINLIVTGGSGNFSYNWSPTLPSTKNPTNLAAGTYKVTITDTTIPNCTWISGNIDVSQPNPIQITGTVTNESCEGELDGSIALTITGGTPPYTSINWGGGNTGNPLQNLAAGTFTPTVTDANGCTQVGPTFTVASSSIDPTATLVNHVTCNGAKNGTITIILPSGSFTVSWAPAGTGNGHAITNLGPGLYTPTIMSSSGCMITLEPIQITEPPAIVITHQKTDVVCFGDSTGSISLTVTGGTGTYTYNWNGNINGKDRTNLKAGIYSVTVTDQSNCTKTQSITIINSNPIIVTSASSTNATIGQSNGSITLTVSGGAAPYGYLWNNQATTKDLSAIPAGQYSVTVTDAAGCKSVRTVTVSQADDSKITFQLSQYDMFNVSCNGTCDGTAVAFAPGSAVPPLIYKWSTNAGGGNSAVAINLCANVIYSITITDVTGKAFTGTTTLSSSQPWNIAVQTTGQPPLAAAYVNISGPLQQPYSFHWNTGDTTESINNINEGNYCVTVTNFRGCTKSACVEIVDMECLLVREVITPNGDNIFDEFKISCITDERYNEHKLEIFNRWGQLVYTTTSYQNDWKGTGPSGTELAEGLYFYVLEYVLFGEPKVLKGTINILR